MTVTGSGSTTPIRPELDARGAPETAQVAALLRLGIRDLGDGKADTAIAALRRAHAVAPTSAAVNAHLGLALQAAGQSREAATMLATALALNPGIVEARYALGTAHLALGDPGTAIACFEAILVTDPAHAEARYGIGTAFQAMGDYQAAMAHYRQALAIDRDFAEASCACGTLHLRLQQASEARACFLQALDVDPDYTEAKLGLAAGLLQMHRYQAAAAEFRRVLRDDPEHAAANCGLAGVLRRKHRDAEAIPLYERVLASDPEHDEALVGLAHALRGVAQGESAVAIYRRILARRPDDPEAIVGLSEALTEQGQFDAARVLLRQAVRQQPERIVFQHRLVNLGKVQPADPIIARLEAMLPRAALLPPDEQVRLRFGLAKAYDDTNRHAKGFHHLLEGNALARQRIPYDERAALEHLARMPAIFTPELMAAWRGRGDPSDRPIFILGMPRSGSTLVEQMLAGHQRIFAGGERHELPEAVENVLFAKYGAPRLSEAIWTLAAPELRQLGSDYDAALRRLAPAAARVTDKLPGNFPLAGLIHLALPNSRIIHVVRDPVDTCLSCFAQLFAENDVPCSYDLAELGRYYRAYRTLMDYWRSVLPAGVMLDVHYEALVDDFPGEARRIVTHCGLDWDDACLETQSFRRVVRTASVVQVRQPIYRSSVGRWRPDSELLQPLLTALGDVA
ncbi:MAG TPA: sulfotransferase [Acetobacteraceae bacterium]|nr:sulfotransferase [Acetobacteraceae bacterium]